MLDQTSTAANCLIVKSILESKPLLTQSEAKTLAKVNDYWYKFCDAYHEKVE